MERPFLWLGTRYMNGALLYRSGRLCNKKIGNNLVQPADTEKLKKLTDLYIWYQADRTELVCIPTRTYTF